MHAVFPRRLLPAVTLVLLFAAASFGGCLQDEAEITTPLTGARSTGTGTPGEDGTPGANGTPRTGPQLSPAAREQVDAIVEDLTAQFCDGECGEGFGESDPATVQGSITDLAVPAATPSGTRLASAFVAPTASGTAATSIQDTTVTLIYVSADGESWLTLSEGPDTREAPLRGEEIELGPTTTGVIRLDDLDNTAGQMEWTTSAEVLYQAAWEGLERADVIDFAETAGGGGD